MRPPSSTKSGLEKQAVRAIVGKPSLASDRFAIVSPAQAENGVQQGGRGGLEKRAVSAIVRPGWDSAPMTGLQPCHLHDGEGVQKGRRGGLGKQGIRSMVGSCRSDGFEAVPDPATMLSTTQQRLAHLLPHLKIGASLPGLGSWCQRCGARSPCRSTLLPPVQATYSLHFATWVS